LALVAILSLSLPAALGQAAAAPAAQVPSAPSAAPSAPVDPLPPADPKFFTSPTPSVETINSFLKQVWGLDPNRLWRVEAVQPTPAPGVIKVTVFVTEKSPDAKVQSATLYVLPDGKHAISAGGGVIAFGAAPFVPLRDQLRAHADGAYRGAAGKDLELVEFADLQCPHCKEAQATIDQIVKDFPKARVVFQLFPLVNIHPSAFKAAVYGVCVRQQSNDAFFRYADAVFDKQDQLTPATDDALLKAAAVSAGLDGDAIAACANTQATKDIVNADIKLAEDAGVDETPLLSANGRLLPLTGMSYDSLKQLIQYQATLDGVESGATAETLAPAPVQPKLTDLPK
jgi:protein-disulfide isomerase